VFLARVVGTVVATRKDPKLAGSKLLVVVPVGPDGAPEGGYVVAVDTVEAGYGDTVLVARGSSARMAEGMKDRPVDASIIGIVDHADVDEPAT
jgi:microcompartment protein CcmK/EutM